MESIRGYLLKTDKSCTPVDSLAPLAAAAAADTKLLWMDIQGEFRPEVEEALSRVLGWHPIVIGNFHLSSSRPKLINFDKYTQLTLHALNLSNPRSEEGRTVEIDVVIAKTYLITYHRTPIHSVEESLEALREGHLASLGPDELLYQLVSRLVDRYVPEVEENKDLIASLEEEALYDPGKDLLERIVLIRDEIIELGLALAPQQLILAQLASGVCRYIRPYIRPFFRDAENRFRNLIDEQNSYKEMVANALELYRSAMSSRTNETMKVLTGMSALFLPLTFLTGLFGMNVDLPLARNHLAFIWIVVICVGAFISMLSYFRVKSWF